MNFVKTKEEKMMNLMNEIKMMFSRITPAAAIADELAEAEMHLLKSETLREYADAQVSYNKNRIKRLKAYVTATPEEKA